VSPLRAPARSHTTTSLLWALVFGLYIFLGGLAIGWARGISLLLAGVTGFGVFLLVRLYGADEPRRP
jgi:hypothetical protein